MERGSHKELIDMGGVYKSLVSRQLVAEELANDEKAANTTAEEET